MADDDNKKTINTIFFVACLLFGVLIFMFTVSAFNNLNTGCTDTTINDCLMINFVLSIAFVTISVSWGICNGLYTCDQSSLFDLNTLLGLCSLVSLAMTIVSFIAYGKIINDNKCLGTDKFSTQDENNNGKRLKIYVLMSAIISLISFLGVNIIIVYEQKAFEKLYEIFMKKKEEDDKKLKARERNNPYGYNPYGYMSRRHNDDDTE